MSKEIKIAENGLTATNSITKVVASMFHDKNKYAELLVNCGKIVACGDLIKTVLGFVTPAKPDPLMKKLLELEKQIAQLSKDMKEQFKKMEAFITEHHFYANCVAPVSTMMEYLKSTTGSCSHDKFEMFRQSCAWPTPLKCARDMISLLEHEPTNPLKKAMQADSLRTKDTFNKWKDIFNDLLSKLLYLECMVNGMFWGQNMIGPNELSEAIVKFQDLMHKWENEYKSDKDGYWQGAKDLVVRVQNNNEHLGNVPKADILKAEFGKILTNHAFYIMVYDHCGSYDNHSFNAYTDQVFYSFRIKGCCVVIYRSLQMNDGHSRTPKDLKKLELQVESCRHNTIPRGWSSFQGFPKTLWEERFSNVGFVGMIKKSYTVVMRDVNSWRDWGPGWWITAHAACDWILIAGYQ